MTHSRPPLLLLLLFLYLFPLKKIFARWIVLLKSPSGQAKSFNPAIPQWWSTAWQLSLCALPKLTKAAWTLKYLSTLKNVLFSFSWKLLNSHLPRSQKSTTILNAFMFKIYYSQISLFAFWVLWQAPWLKATWVCRLLSITEGSLSMSSRQAPRSRS